MSRRIKGGGAVIAAVSAGAVAGAIAAALSVNLLGEQLIAMPTANAAQFETQPQSTALTVNREGKGDALPLSNAPQTRAEIKSVEVVGVRGASIVYRDRAGNILFQTDPLANVTIVTKNVELPEVTIREAETTKVERLPAEDLDRSPQPHGCESAFARPSPESLIRTSSRCVTSIQPTTHDVAALQ